MLSERAKKYLLQADGIEARLHSLGLSGSNGRVGAIEQNLSDAREFLEDEYDEDWDAAECLIMRSRRILEDLEKRVAGAVATDKTLGELLSSSDETIRRNAISILKRLQSSK